MSKSIRKCYFKFKKILFLFQNLSRNRIYFLLLHGEKKELDWFILHEKKILKEKTTMYLLN